MDNKRKRSEDHYANHYKPINQLQPIITDNSGVLQQQIIGEEQYAEVQLLNGSVTGQNTQSNLVYIILPPGVNQSQNLLQNVQTLLLVPKEDQTGTGEGPPQLHYYMPHEKPDHKIKTDDDEEDVVFVKDTKLKDFIAGYPETDPLEIQEGGSNVSYTLAPSYEEVQQEPQGSVYVFNNSDKLANQRGPEYTADSLKYKMQFKCDFPGCLLTFPSVYEKKIHADTHIFPSSSEYKCTICNAVFDRAIDRNKHVDSHAVVNTYKCKNCDCAFPYYTTLVKHINEDKCCSNKSYACHYCGVQFVDIDDLETHQKENMKFCVCRARICSDQALELHSSLCTVYKQKMGKGKMAKRKKGYKIDDLVVVLDD